MDENIRIKELNRLLKDNEPPLVIDVRNQDAFAAGHIPGAMNIPVKRLQYHVGSVPNDRPIVLYTSQGEIGKAPEREEPPDKNMVKETADMMRERGYKVQVLDEGLNAWVDAGLPIEIE